MASRPLHVICPHSGGELQSSEDFKTKSKDECFDENDSIEIPIKIGKSALIFKEDDASVQTETTAASTCSRSTLSDIAGNAEEAHIFDSEEIMSLEEDILQFRFSATDCYHLEEDNDPSLEVSYMIPTAKIPKPRKSSLAPITIGVIGTIGAVTSKTLLKVLLDPGSTRTLINKKVLPKNVNPAVLQSKTSVTTIAGTFSPTEMVYLRDIRLPEFDKNRQIDEIKALTFDAQSRYDVILGTDFLTKSGINIQYSTGTMEWFENVINMRSPYDLNIKEYLAMADAIEIQREDDTLGIDWLDCYLSAPILDAKYVRVDINDVARQQPHLNKEQQEQLQKVLSLHEKLFDGTLGVYPHKKVHIEIDPDAQPVHARPYAVPKIHLLTFKKELDHLVKIGVLSPQGASEWASPTFIVPKKDGRVRWVSDLRTLNKAVKRRQYPLPIIADVLKKRKGYKYFTKLDISMQYYTFELDDESKDLCTICTPFGKYKYNRLPMGLKCSPDIAQEVMENILRHIEDCDCYIDDVGSHGCFSNDWDEHLKLLDTIL